MDKETEEYMLKEIRTKLENCIFLIDKQLKHSYDTSRHMEILGNLSAVNYWLRDLEGKKSK